MVKLFVGGLSWGTNDQSLYDAFAQFGEVQSANVILDRDTGRSRGFGFVSYNTEEEATAAVENMDGQELDGRRIKVDRATDRGDRPPRRDFGGNRGRGGYGGGYGGDNGGYGGGY
ncbi:uncharacterized protein BYT42DRAFT_71038 [Radiomyces spectabilis]|uniref:uncharacterized protein n=1 Tax=Radiomyces spectabilis TaxID=64574 RepID=UPI002220FF4F|nr:uncharacterized protein BYT42DRAFT_71038 [Radiomyces spectabilis]KAI8371511.1 hypothetical protein BYT42DRAFT_71038 [Radiomyces spectabilis]